MIDHLSEKAAVTGHMKYAVRNNEVQGFIKGADKSRWASRTSNPSGGVVSVSGGFDSHALPPPIRHSP